MEINTKKHKTVVLVQARENSTRFPKKVLYKINGKSIIQIIVSRLSKSKNVDKIIVAIPNNKKNKNLEKHLKVKKIKFFKGPEHDVLKRFYKIAKKTKAQNIVRVTGDCPLVDPFLLDKIVKRHFLEKAEYSSNIYPASFPDGMDVEVISFKILEKLEKITKKLSDREHVTTLINKINCKKINLLNTKDLSKENLTLDEKNDLWKIKKIFNYFYPRIVFSFDEINKAMIKMKLFKVGNKLRNEGFKMGVGQKFWRRAKNSIEGGNMLLSKREDRFAPNLWPCYFSKAKQCYVWDLNNKKFTDFSLMGVGTNILGYSNPEVDNAVKNTIQKGNLTTLNCPEEVFLAEKLISLHPWASKSKFTRSGGEANAVAIRIARAAAGPRYKIAICGYHGWHDWYISANLNKSNNLKNHLIDGIPNSGVPKKLKNTVFTFRYNEINDLKKIIKKHPDVGIIKMEVMRNFPPKNNFLNKVRRLANKYNIILIFDECTSGFRENFGGLHMKYKVYPDLAVFGKALGNGYAINAILGKSEVMKHANNSFISSTFWTERIGPTAGLKTLQVMERTKSWKKISLIGKKIKKSWIKLSKKYKLKISISGLDALCTFNFINKNNLKYQTFLTQEMLKKNFLASNTIYISVHHDNNILKKYFKNLECIFKTIRDCEMNKKNIDNLLEGPTKTSGFSRLN
tara:strand:- start:1085 stop:3133 length:2049 start_codon:yes stop_codon:yes gene_type:complete